MKKKIRIILAILAVLIVVAIIAISVLTKKAENEGHTHDDDEFEDESYELEEYEEEEMFMPYGSSQIVFNYKGEWSRNRIYESIYKFVNMLPEFVEKLETVKDEDIEKYFEDNKEYIYENFGLSNSYDFIELAKYLKRYNNIGKYKDVEIIEGSSKNATNYFIFNLLCVFENENEVETTLIFRTSFSNYIDIEPMVMFRKGT